MAHQEQEDCTREIIHTLRLSTLARYRLPYTEEAERNRPWKAQRFLQSPSAL